MNDEVRATEKEIFKRLELFGNSEQLPPAQPELPDTNVGDPISRQAAIDAVQSRGEVRGMKNKYIVYGTFDVEVEANSEEEAKSQFDIGDADVAVHGCYRSDDEAESEDKE